MHSLSIGVLSMQSNVFKCLLSRNRFPIFQPCGRTDGSRLACGEPVSLSKNKKPPFNFRVGKALHTIPASHPRRQARLSERVKKLDNLPWATCAMIGHGPWKPHSIFKSHFKQRLSHTVRSCCRCVLHGGKHKIRKQASLVQGVYTPIK